MKQQYILNPSPDNHSRKTKLVFATKEKLDRYIDEHNFKRTTGRWLFDKDGDAWQWYAIQN